MYSRRVRNLILTSTPSCAGRNAHGDSHTTSQKIAIWTYSLMDIAFELKLYFVVNEKPEIGTFPMKPGNLHDVIAAEDMLEDCKE